MTAVGLNLNELFAITASIASVFALIIAIISFRSKIIKNKQLHDSLFKHAGWIKSSQIIYENLDNLRRMQKEANPTSLIGIAESIRKILDKRNETDAGNHILLVGPSLSGKTHITVSILQTLNDAYVLIPNTNVFNETRSSVYELPDAPFNAQYKIVLFDNFHEFFKGDVACLKELLSKVVQKNYIIWANCISIEEYVKVKSVLDFRSGPMGLFREILIDKKLSLNEARKFSNNKLPKTWNGLIGEIYYSPADMIQHCEDLKSDVVSYDVLVFLKQAYMLGAFTLPYLMKIQVVKGIFFKKYSADNFVLLSALKKIEQKGFIKLSYDHESLYFDPVWLNEIVEPQMKAREFYNYWNEILPKNVVYYTNLMCLTSNYNEVLSYYTEMRNGGIVPDVRSFTILISLSPDYSTALDWFNKISEANVNEFSYSALISLSPTYEIALAWFNKIENGTATTITFNSLIFKSLNYETALHWYKQIGHGKETISTYNSLIIKSPDYKTAMEWFEIITFNRATSSTYNALCVKAPDYETSLMWYNKIDKGKITPSSYNSLCVKSPDYKTALEWYDKIEPDKIPLNTFNSLIIKSPNYLIAIEWLNKVEFTKLSSSAFNTILRLAPTYNISVDWFNKIPIGSSNVITYNILIGKSITVEDAEEWLKQLNKSNLLGDEFTYRALLKIVNRFGGTGKYQKAVSFHEEMLNMNINSNVIFYTLLIKLAPDFDIGFRLLNEMINHKDKNGIKIIPNARTKETIINKTFGNPDLIKKVEMWFEQNVFES